MFNARIWKRLVLYIEPHMHKICWPDVGKSATRSGTSHLPLSGGTVDSHHSVPRSGALRFGYSRVLTEFSCVFKCEAGFNHSLYNGGKEGGESRWRRVWATALQAWKQRVRFPMVSLKFFIDIALGSIQPLTEMSTRNISWECSHASVQFFYPATWFMSQQIFFYCYK